KFLRWNCLPVARSLCVNHEIDSHNPDDRLAVRVRLRTFSSLHLEQRRTRLRRNLLRHLPAARDGCKARAEGRLQCVKERGIDLLARSVHGQAIGTRLSAFGQPATLSRRVLLPTQITGAIYEGF